MADGRLARKQQENADQTRPGQGRSSQQIPQQAYQAPLQHSPYTAQSPYQSYQSSRIPPTAMTPAPYSPNAPRPVEVYTLPDDVNDSIDESVREQFQCDTQGRLLFFAIPPLDPVGPTDQTLSHSAKYLSTREERKERMKRKRDCGEQIKKDPKSRKEDEDILNKALEMLARHLEAANEAVFRSLGQRVPKGRLVKVEALEKADTVFSGGQARLSDSNLAPYRETIDVNAPAYFLADSSDVMKLELPEALRTKTLPSHHSIGRLGMKSW
ncbi:hypothetical protein KEM56_001734 [Ascosphaera pollenicola]|nr:hypothetical protein KEM56_001734 [Ascosphaera pollenicola]